MTILSTVQQVCPVIGLNVPTALFSSTAREAVELKALANEMAQRIAFDTHDWNRLKALATLNGDGATQAMTLPADYRRMIKKARLWPSSSPFTTLTHYPDADQWLGMQVQNFQQITGAWTIIGTDLLVNPPVPSGQTVKFYYISDRIIAPGSGANKTQFTADDDTFRLDERVLKLGMIWQWRANKGVPYAEDMQNYEDALAVSAGSDRGSNIMKVGQPRVPAGLAAMPYPWVITP